MPTEYMTPEERAKAIIAAEDDWTEVYPHEGIDIIHEKLEAMITAAIRAAENDMAERAAKMADNFTNAGPEDIAEHPQMGAFQREIGSAIRALKHKDPA